MSSSPASSSSETSLISVTQNSVATSRLGDYIDLLYLHPSDSSNTTLISCVLIGCDNYVVWSKAMMFSLDDKNKLGFVENLFLYLLTLILLINGIGLILW